jgi:uncharacterized SAM-binding protein YcdF (DUF218 family)
VALFRTRKAPIILLVALIAGVAITHTIWMSALGAYLIRADQPTHADYAVVLAGDFFGHRIIEGAELVRQGFVRKALISGPKGCYGAAESELAVNFAVKHGYPADYFVPFPHSATSTREEARVVVPELRRLGAHSFLLVTSNYHTRRAARYFRDTADGIEMHVIAAPDEHFRPDSWWRDREAQKIFYLEWSKTVASLLGM